jgi:DNA polymerase III sliding clamp (beta) subunit (PCNA family)
MTPNSITLPISSLKSYLNKALVFISKTRMSSNPLYCCLLFKEDKVYANNGETGAIINFPLTVPQATLMFPFDLSFVVNSSNEAADITLSFDYESMWCKVSCGNINVKIKLLDPKEFAIPEIPDDLELFSVEGFYDKVKRASFATHIDIAQPVLQGVKINKTSVCTMDRASAWREDSESTQEFLIPALLVSHIEKLGLEPTQLAINDCQIHIIYNDMVMFSPRLAEEAKFPALDNVFENKIRPQGDAAVVDYDRESLTQEIEKLMQLSVDDGINLSCKDKVLCAQKIVKDSNETDAKVLLPVNSTEDFSNVTVNGKLFLNGVQRFIRFNLKEDGKRIYFHRETSMEYVIATRDVR